MPHPLLALKQVSKRFGYRTVLENINLEVQPNDCLLLLGNNGAGKTTLLQLISFLMRPSAGEIFFKGKKYQKATLALRRALGTLSHESRLYGDLTAEENLKLFGTLYSIQSLASEIDRVLEAVELDYAKRLPLHTFSRGMTQRLAIAKVMLCGSELLILDEPYTGLDPNSTASFQEYLKQYQLAGGTIVLVTHQFSLGLEVANRVLVIQQKQILHDTLASQVSSEQCGLWLQQN